MSTVEKEVLSRSELSAEVAEREAELAELKARLAGWEEAYDETAKRAVWPRLTSNGALGAKVRALLLCACFVSIKSPVE